MRYADEAEIKVAFVGIQRDLLWAQAWSLIKAVGETFHHEGEKEKEKDGEEFWRLAKKFQDGAEDLF